MLSKELMDRLNFNGLYSHEPDERYTHSKDFMFWCKNWTFRPHLIDDEVYMVDTYWSSGGGLSIKLTDDNFNEFEFIFDFNDVIKVDELYLNEYGVEGIDWWYVPIDSGGINNKRGYIRKGATRSIQAMIDRKYAEIEKLNRRIDYIKSEIKYLESQNYQDFRGENG